MGKKLTALIVVAFMSGCSGLPTLDYCDHIKYERTGVKATLIAECTLPVGGIISIPVAK